MQSVRITVVGSCNTDLVVRVPHLPLPGETLLGDSLERHLGGKGANQAVAARRHGAEVWFVGCLGADPFGDDAAAQLAHEGLRLDHLERATTTASGVALIAVAQDGQNSIIVAPGANAQLSPASIDCAQEIIAASQGIIAQLEIPLPTVRRALEVARAAHIPTLLNAAPAQPLPDDLLALVDVLVCNETEAEALTQLPVIDRASATSAAHMLRQRGSQCVIITLGGDGSLVMYGTGVHYITAYRVQVVDTTAAGDAFIGALAYRLAQGDTPENAAHYATAAAALSVGKNGAVASLPTAAQVATFLRQQAPDAHPA